MEGREMTYLDRSTIPLAKRGGRITTQFANRLRQGDWIESDNAIVAMLSLATANTVQAILTDGRVHSFWPDALVNVIR
jgi:hypothetical protein